MFNEKSKADWGVQAYLQVASASESDLWTVGISTQILYFHCFNLVCQVNLREPELNQNPISRQLLNNDQDSTGKNGLAEIWQASRCGLRRLQIFSSSCTHIESMGQDQSEMKFRFAFSSRLCALVLRLNRRWCVCKCWKKVEVSFVRILGLRHEGLSYQTKGPPTHKDASSSEKTQ